MRQDNYRGFDDEQELNGCAVCSSDPQAIQATPVTPTFPVNANTLFGIDVSHHQGTIDWKKVKAAGVQYVFLKATEGETFVDKMYATNRAGARAQGIPCGAYHFFRPKANLQKQIDNFVRAVGKLQPGDLPPVLDVEVPEDWKDIKVADRVKMIQGWLDAVEAKLGVKPIVYINNPMTRDELGGAPMLKNYILWLAHYTNRAAPNVPKPWDNWTFWQYSELGQVDGVPSKTCDMNRFAGTIEDLRKLLVPGAATAVAGAKAPQRGLRRRFVDAIAWLLRV